MKLKLFFIILIILSLSIITACSGKKVKLDGTPSDNIERTGKTGEILIPGNSVKESGLKDIKSATGTFDVSMGSFRGELKIDVIDGRFYGTLKFYNWGNGVPQPLKNLRINNDRIYFVRSITTKEELERYGGTAYFTQEFYGIFSGDSRLIRGYYRFLGAQDNWEARRK